MARAEVTPSKLGKEWEDVTMEEIMKIPYALGITRFLAIHKMFWIENNGINRIPLEEFGDIKTWVIEDIVIVVSWIIAGVYEDQCAPIYHNYFVNTLLSAASTSMIYLSFCFACESSAAQFKRQESHSGETRSTSTEKCLAQGSDELTSKNWQVLEHSSKMLPEWKMFHVTKLLERTDQKNDLTYADVIKILENLESCCREYEKIIMKALFAEVFPEEKDSECLLDPNDNVPEVGDKQGQTAHSDSKIDSSPISATTSLTTWIKHAEYIFSSDDIFPERASRTKSNLYRYGYMVETESRISKIIEDSPLQGQRKHSSHQRDGAPALESSKGIGFPGISHAMNVGDIEKSVDPRLVRHKTSKERNADLDGEGMYVFALLGQEGVDEEAKQHVILSGPKDTMLRLDGKGKHPCGMSLLVQIFNRAAESWERISDLKLSSPLPMPESIKQNVKHLFSLLYSNLKVLKLAVNRKKSIKSEVQLSHILRRIRHFPPTWISEERSGGTEDGSFGNLQGAAHPKGSGVPGPSSSIRRSNSRKGYSKQQGTKRQLSATDGSSSDADSAGHSHLGKGGSAIASELNLRKPNSYKNFSCDQEELWGYYTPDTSEFFRTTTEDSSSSPKSNSDKDFTHEELWDNYSPDTSEFFRTTTEDPSSSPRRPDGSSNPQSEGHASGSESMEWVSDETQDDSLPTPEAYEAVSPDAVSYYGDISASESDNPPL